MIRFVRIILAALQVPEPILTENLKTLPLDAWHRSRDARMVPFAGYAMPVQFEGVMAEHLWTRAHAGLFDVSHMGQVRLWGVGTAAALEAITPGNLQALKPGKIKYTLLLAPDGGILDDLMVTNAHDHLYLVVNGATKHDDIAYLRANLPDDVRLDYDDAAALLALQGPEAVTCLARLVPGAADLYFMEAGPFHWGDIPLGISRSGYTGEDGFEISLAPEHAAAFADALCAMDEVKPIGLGARDSLRLEAGLPLYGHDLNPSLDPAQGDLTFAVSKKRAAGGGFCGAERIAAALEAGPDKKRVGFAIEGKMPVREGAPIFAGDTEIGTVTSGGFGPSVGAPIAMGYVATKYAAVGEQVEAEVRGKRVAMTVTNMPFIPHRYHRKGAEQ